MTQRKSMWTATTAYGLINCAILSTFMYVGRLYGRQWWGFFAGVVVVALVMAGLYWIETD